jgi:hypothetical protein
MTRNDAGTFDLLIFIPAKTHNAFAPAIDLPDDVQDWLANGEKAAHPTTGDCRQREPPDLPPRLANNGIF